VLTSRDTGSAAEDFAFLLQQTDTNAVLGIGGGYAVSVSIGRTFNPQTNKGWEGTGVQPTVRAPASDALDTAHRLALTTLIEKTSDATVRQELSWSRDTIDARLKPIAVDEQTLKAYAGQYGVRAFTLASGRLWYQRAADAEKIPLVALSAHEFAMGEGQRFRFVVKGASTEMQMLNADGTHVPFTREGR
jgi:hypothetical protein